jgi:hypothetical protein
MDRRPEYRDRNDPTPVPRHQWLAGRRSGIMRWMSDLAETELKSPDWNPSQLALYFALAYGFSLVLWLPMLLERNHSRFSFSIGTFGPTLAAFATHWIFARNWRAVGLWTTLPSLLLGVGFGVSAVLAAAFLAAFFMTKSGFGRWQWPVFGADIDAFWAQSRGRTAGRGARLAGICSPEIAAPLQSAGVFSHPWVYLGQLASSVDACSRL